MLRELHLHGPGSTSRLRLARRNDGVTQDKLGHDTTNGLDIEGKRADVDKNNVTKLFVSRENTTLDGSTARDGLVRVDTLWGILVEVSLQELWDLQDTGEHEHVEYVPHQYSPS